MQEVTVYGTDDCEDTERSLELLREHGVPHVYLNVDEDAAALAQVEIWYPGHFKTPIVLLEMDGIRLVEPTNEELMTALRSAS